MDTIHSQGRNLVQIERESGYLGRGTFDTEIGERRRPISFVVFDHHVSWGQQA
jgi:hypothetical protein